MFDDCELDFSLLDKFDILFDNKILSKEKIIRYYLDFLTKNYTNNNSVNICLHTGDIAFRAITIASVLIAYIVSLKSKNNQKQKYFSEGETVTYEGHTWKYKGEQNGEIILEKEGKKKSGPITTHVSQEKIRFIQRYHGSSKGTSRRRTYKSSQKTSFISFILGSNNYTFPIDFSVIIVSSRKEFEEIYSKLYIKYNDELVRFTEIISAMYYTKNMQPYQIGNNSEKNESIIKVTDSMRISRKIINDQNSENKVWGILITELTVLADCKGDLEFIHDGTYSPLHFFFITVPYSVFVCTLLKTINFFEGMSASQIFICSADYIKVKELNTDIISSNDCTESLKLHVSNIVSKEHTIVKVNNYWDKIDIHNIRNKIYKIANNKEWSSENNFVLIALGLYFLFESAFFGFCEFDGTDKMISNLREIIKNSTRCPKECNDILDFFDEVFEMFRNSTPKGEALLSILEQHPTEKIALIVPKKYFIDIFHKMYYGTQFKNVSCIYFKKFDATSNYDLIITLKDHNDSEKNIEFDAFQCCSTSKLILVLYDYEVDWYLKRKAKIQKIENYINHVAGITSDNTEEQDNTMDISEQENVNATLEKIPSDNFVPDDTALEKLIDSLDVSSSNIQFDQNNDDCNGKVEICRIGLLSNGAKFLFSKNYMAVVFNRNSNEVKEIEASEINEGDELIFVKNDKYAKNMVDFILDKLKEENLLNDEISQALEQAESWRTALRKYHKSHKTYKYADVAFYLTKRSQNKRNYDAQTIRQWLIEDSSIIGPQKEEDYLTIAELTKDPNLSDPKKCYEACRTVRKYRGKIRDFMKDAITSSLGSTDSSDDPIINMIHDNIKKLAETAELLKITDIEKGHYVSIGKANRFIYDSEELCYE